MRKVLGIFPTRRYVLTPDGQAARADLRNRMELGQTNLRGWVHDCPPQGDGGDATLNQTKNRIDEGNYQQVTFDALANLPWPKDAEGKSRDQWSQPVKDEIGRSEGLPLIVDGYLVKVQENQPEAQNCHSNDYKTWQLWLLGAAGTTNDTPKAILVGVSPRVRANHNGWTLDKLNALAGAGAKIRVSGWLM